MLGKCPATELHPAPSITEKTNKQNKMRWSLLWNTLVFAGLVAKQTTLSLILISPRTRGCEQKVGGWKRQMEGQSEDRGWVGMQDRWKGS